VGFTIAAGRVGLRVVGTSDGGSPVSVGLVGQRVPGEVLKGGDDRTSLAAWSSPCVVCCSSVSDHVVLPLCLTASIPSWKNVLLSLQLWHVSPCT